MAVLRSTETPTLRFMRRWHGYGNVVYAEFEDTNGTHNWHPVCKFGDNQSEAYEFMRHADEVEPRRLRMLVDSYTPGSIVRNHDRKIGVFKVVRRMSEAENE